MGDEEGSEFGFDFEGMDFSDIAGVPKNMDFADRADIPREFNDNQVEKEKIENEIRKFKEALKKGPITAKIFAECSSVIFGPLKDYMLGQAAQAECDLDKAAAHYGIAIMSSNEEFRGYDWMTHKIFFDSLTRRGGIFLVKGMAEKAEQDFNEALKLDPIDANLFLSRGQAREMIGDLEAAIKDYSTAIRYGLGLEHDTHFEVLYSMRAGAKLKAQDYEGAKSDIEIAIDLSANDFQNYDLKADILIKQWASKYKERSMKRYSFKLLDEAIASLDESLKINPKNSYALRLRAATRVVKAECSKSKRRTSWLRQAERDYCEYIHMNPEDSSAYADRGDLRLRMGNTEFALIDYERAIALNHTSLEIQRRFNSVVDKVLEQESKG